MSKRLNGLVAAALAAFISTPALAILPDSGMWSIGAELNGKPGRGIQIDRQGGSTLILTYFGYRADGSSLFLQAAGTLKDGKQFDGVLTEYRNGRALGGQARDGEFAQEAGPVRIVFDSSTTATITLPGEAPQRLQRFQFEDLRKRLNGKFVHSNSSEYANLSPGRITIQAGENTLTMTEAPNNSSGGCQYTGDLKPAGDGFHSKGSARCVWGERINDFAYEAKHLKVDEFGNLSARLYLGSPQQPGVYNFRQFITGICEHQGAIFLATPRCYPDALQVDPALQRE
ncbi:hypothetical protein [Delftia sp. JD2]|jgi:hypothetical protein|uniref:hypothetical protein n=1 Tax=Delftia sp. JD2 TaxID=469553 RepID=UPI000806B5DF|nr:hypothetical protein [Delftia sp. JD2]OBY82391.1 hypothetical protein ACM14_26395 [Delftia sp. JD2]